jgi:hypothetical protein
MLFLSKGCKEIDIKKAYKKVAHHTHNKQHTQLLLRISTSHRNLLFSFFFGLRTRSSRFSSIPTRTRLREPRTHSKVIYTPWGSSRSPTPYSLYSYFFPAHIYARVLLQQSRRPLPASPTPTSDRLTTDSASIQITASHRPGTARMPPLFGWRTALRTPNVVC